MTHQLIERAPELIEMIKLADKNFKIASIVNTNISKIQRNTWT